MIDSYPHQTSTQNNPKSQVLINHVDIDDD